MKSMIYKIIKTNKILMIAINKIKIKIKKENALRKTL